MELLQAIVNGLLIGGVYAVISIGLTLVFGVMSIVNFAQAEFLMIGMYVGYYSWRAFGLDPVLGSMIAFGVAFLFPVLVTFLNMVGAFPLAKMQGWRRGMVVGIFAASAIITPSQDPFTFMAMGLPLYALYEGCIVIARIRERATRRRRAVEPGAQDLERLGDDETSRVEDRPSPL